MPNNDFLIKNGLRVTSNLAVGSSYVTSNTVPVTGTVIQGIVGIGTTTPVSTSNVQVYGNVALSNSVVRGSVIFSDGTAQYTASATRGTAVYQYSGAGNAAPTSTTVFTMQGMKGSITPNGSRGVAMLFMSGYLTSGVTTVNTGIIFYLAYGTGTAPSANASATGTTASMQMEYTLPIAATAAANIRQPVSLIGSMTGLTAGTTYWIDVAAKAVTTGSQVAINQVSLTAIEL